MRIFSKFLIILPLFFLSCAFSTKDNGPYAHCVDMERFSGLWFEIARKPIFFQGTCSLCWTEYKVCIKNEVPLVLVKTLCVLPNGELKKLCGTGKIYDHGYNRRLLLSFSLYERIENLLGQYNPV